MSWLQTHEISIPSFRTTEEPRRRPRATVGVFQITLSVANGDDDINSGRVTIDRPMAAFRGLRDELLRLTRPSPAHRACSWVRRVMKTSACTCESPSLCPFQKKLHAAIQSMELPASSSTRRSSKHSQLSGHTQRVPMERWLRRLHGVFASFSGMLLQSKYQRGDCAVLNCYASFLEAKTHFRVFDASTLRQPLTLRAWRAERDEVVRDTLAISSGEEEGPKTCEDLLNPAEASQQDGSSLRLPRLEIKRVGLATLQSFLEDFCDMILTQYGQDIAELKSQELTTARRWEIALYVACRIGHSYGAQLILFFYADANVTMADGTSCLHIAARMGRTAIVSMLLQEGADVNRASKTGITPLIAACRNGCSEVTKLLLNAGACVSAASAKGTQPLHAAIVSQSTEIVQLLLDSGADVRARTASGLTPLHFAAKLGSVELTQVLLKHRADPEQQTTSGSDAIEIASLNGHMEICELFQKEMDRKNFLSSSGGKLFQRFKKPVVSPSTAME